MKFHVLPTSYATLAMHTTDALVVVVAGDSLPASLEPAIAGLVEDAAAHGDFEFKAGAIATLLRPSGLKAKRLVLVASGATLREARSAVSTAIVEIGEGGSTSASIVFLGFDSICCESLGEQTVLAALDAAYTYRATKPSAPPTGRLKQVMMLADIDDADLRKAMSTGIARGVAIGAGIELARECANLPPNLATPSYLGEQATLLGKTHGIRVEVLEERAIERLGMGSFLSVARGSNVPARFIVAKYEGGAKSHAPIVLIGKGITFDSGGISLKPGASMDEMKFDMSGAAAVLGALRAVAQLEPLVNVVALIPACENMPGSRALKPGDVVTSMSGQTVEVLNTDAEGRLILCDALTYAERFKPQCVVDVATLTGACVVALGNVRSGMFASDDDLASALSSAGETALDPCWRMPLDEDYAEGLKSNFADVANVTGGREGGSITAAKFLQRFTGSFRWGHLDIAGTAWKSGKNKGATGRPVGLLTHFVLSQAR